MQKYLNTLNNEVCNVLCWPYHKNKLLWGQKQDTLRSLLCTGSARGQNNLRIVWNHTIRLRFCAVWKRGLQREQYSIITTTYRAKQISLSDSFLFVDMINDCMVQSLDGECTNSIETHCYLLSTFVQSWVWSIKITT